MFDGAIQKIKVAPFMAVADGVLTKLPSALSMHAIVKMFKFSKYTSCTKEIGSYLVISFLLSLQVDTSIVVMLLVQRKVDGS